MAFRTVVYTAGQFSGTEFVADLPGSIVSGERLLIMVSIDWPVDDDDLTISGYAVVGNEILGSPDGHSVLLFERIATGGEGADVTLVGSAIPDGRNTAVLAAVWNGRHSTTPAIVQSSQSTGGAEPETIGATGVTAATGDDIAWFAAGDPTNANHDWAFTPPGSYIERADPGASGGSQDWCPVTLATRDNVSAGATGTLSGSIGETTPTGNNVGWMAFVVLLAAATGQLFDREVSDGRNIITVLF